ncbi:hypothetical protein GZH46_01441 [Fragariocoptes setiger]|uniref:Uncharacterized protein n=1 Tax=Fragariocoptes setiger TaxID=1670756 RepID=A0ABQ7S9A6_9ACAR|nr:hypothetical protein GZH46_01441 [Fragariocoptes setiger]
MGPNRIDVADNNDDDIIESEFVGHQHKHALHRFRRQKKKAPNRDLVISFLPKLRVSIIDRKDLYHRFGKQEQEVLACFDFLDALLAPNPATCSSSLSQRASSPASSTSSSTSSPTCRTRVDPTPLRLHTNVDDSPQSNKVEGQNSNEYQSQSDAHETLADDKGSYNQQLNTTTTTITGSNNIEQQPDEPEQQQQSQQLHNELDSHEVQPYPHSQEPDDDPLSLHQSIISDIIYIEDSIRNLVCSTVIDFETNVKQEVKHSC